jgi:hypothetical protein
MDTHEIWDMVIEKETKYGLDALSKKEATIYHVYRFCGDFDNGGLTGFLYNLSPDWNLIHLLQEEMRNIGCPEISNILAKVASLFDCPKASSIKEKTWEEFLVRIDPQNSLDQFCDQLSSCLEDYWGTLEAFTQKNYK